jgi:hypothetical protein
MPLAYPVVSADHQMLRLTAVEELEHIAPALDPAIRCGRAPRPQAEEGLKGCHWLSPAIVAEHELIEVRLELGTADAMMGTNQPVLEVTDDAIGERYDRGRDHVRSPMDRSVGRLLSRKLTSEFVQILWKRRARHTPTLQIAAG